MQVDIPKSTSSGSPPSTVSGRLYCKLRYWQMFCVTTLLTSCFAYGKHSRHLLVRWGKAWLGRASPVVGEGSGRSQGRRSYLLCTEPDAQREEDPLQVSPVQVATPVGIEEHESQEAIQGEHGRGVQLLGLWRKYKQLYDGTQWLCGAGHSPFTASSSATSL